MTSGNSVADGLIRYEYKGSIIEETRKDGKEHGLRVCIVVTGDLYLRFYDNGKRLAQIVLGGDCSV